MPESLTAKDVLPCHNSKSRFVDCLTSPAIAELQPSPVDGIVVDLSFIIQAQAATIENGMSFEAFVVKDLNETAHMRVKLEANRINLVADESYPSSIKCSTEDSGVPEKASYSI